MTSRPANELEMTISAPKRGELVTSAPIAFDGLVYIGNAGGDFRGGKGLMFALDAKTGKIVWEFFLVPKEEGDIVCGALGATPLDASKWKNAPGLPISGGGVWTSEVARKVQLSDRWRPNPDGRQRHRCWLAGWLGGCMNCQQDQCPSSIADTVSHLASTQSRAAVILPSESATHGDPG